MGGQVGSVLAHELLLHTIHPTHVLPPLPYLMVTQRATKSPPIHVSGAPYSSAATSRQASWAPRTATMRGGGGGGEGGAVDLGSAEGTMA